MRGILVALLLLLAGCSDGGGSEAAHEDRSTSEPCDPNNPPAGGCSIDTSTDPDADGLSNDDEEEHGTDPNKRDTDGDGLTDGEEVHTYETDPLKKDSDGDGLNDFFEVKTIETDPNNPDSDSDGYNDGEENANGWDPKDADSPGPLRDPVTWDIAISGNDFVDGSISIQVGDNVRWTTSDNVPHTVTANEGEFHSGDCPGAQCLTPANPAYSFEFESVGEFAYHCDVHPSMTDTITVLQRYDAAPG